MSRALRVGLDLQLATGSATGIGEYARGLFDALRAGDDADLTVVGLAAPRLDPWRFDRRLLWDQVLLPLRARAARVDVLHCTAGTVPRFAPAPVIATVHDVAWLRVQSHTRAYARAYFGAFALAGYRRARRLLVDSQFSRGELLAVAPELDPARIVVVYPGVAADVMAVVRAPADAPFALAVGTVEPRKNLATVVRALVAVPEIRLISVGPPTPYLEHCRTLARELGVANRFEVRGYVARSELLALYARATCAVVPSYYEGFGYGAAQALCAGVPLIAARTSSLGEVVGEAAPLLDPDDVASWSAALQQCAAAPDEARARADAARAAACARFGWAAAAAAVRGVYRTVLER